MLGALRQTPVRFGLRAYRPAETEAAGAGVEQSRLVPYDLLMSSWNEGTAASSTLSLLPSKAPPTSYAFRSWPQQSLRQHCSCSSYVLRSIALFTICKLLCALFCQCC